MMEKVQYVSFDIYNTLIGRLYSTETLYRMIGEKIQLDGLFQMPDFSAKRIEAEKILAAQGKRHYGIWNIYSTGVFADLDDQKRNYLVQLEEEYEAQNTYPLAEGKRLYEQYKDQKKRIICISDMYLGSRILKKILDKNGFQPDKIYVSCECEASKRDGSLYEYVLCDLSVNAREVLHIGDAIRSDIINAAKKGLIFHRVSRNDMISYNKYFDLGFRRFGKIIFEFIKWIHKHSEGRKRIFLTREGAFFQQCFQILYDDDSLLLAVSRKSVITGVLPIILKQKRISEIVSDMSLQLTDTVEDLFRRLGLNIDNYRIELQDVGVHGQESISKQVKKKLDLFVEKNRHKVSEELTNYQKLFDCYLKQFADIDDSVALIDIGWKGSMQNALQTYWKLNNGPEDILGLYFGVVQQENKKGFLFDAGEKREQDTLCFSGLIEVLTTPYMGSVIGYQFKEDLVVPVYAKPEVSEESREYIDDVQSGIFEYIRRASFFKNNTDERLEKEMDRFVHWGCFPRRTEIKLLGSLDIYDNDIYLKLIEPIAIGDLIHPGEIKRKLLQSKWKTGALKRLLIINFPYNRLVNYLRKKNKEKQL